MSLVNQFNKSWINHALGFQWAWRVGASCWNVLVRIEIDMVRAASERIDDEQQARIEMTPIEPPASDD